MKTVPVLQKKVDILNRRVTELSEEFSALALSGKRDFDPFLPLIETLKQGLTTISAGLKEWRKGGVHDFVTLLTAYLEKNKALAKQFLLSGAVFYDVKTKGYIFLFRAFSSFLRAHHFNTYGNSELQIKLRELGAEPVKYYINKKTGRIRAWRISAANYLKLKEKVNKK